MSEAPRVLFLSPRREEYLADSVFHGLRSLLGDRVVDYPKHEIMYSSCSEESIGALVATDSRSTACSTTSRSTARGRSTRSIGASSIS